MKKSLVILFTILVLASGCGKKEENNNIDSKTNEQEVINNKEESNKLDDSNKKEDNAKENASLNNKKEDVNSDKSNEKKPSKNDTDSKTNTKNDTSLSSKQNSTVKLGENEYISLKDNKVHKYTFTYPDKETCEKTGDQEPYDIVNKVRYYSFFGCEEVKDANGNILWGEYFMETNDKNSIFYF